MDETVSENKAVTGGHLITPLTDAEESKVYLRIQSIETIIYHFRAM